MEVPAILRSGHHANIAKWRLQESLKRTQRLRPDLLDRELTKRRAKGIEGDCERRCNFVKSVKKN